MITRHNCLSCGADLDPTSNEGLCPACMLRSVLTPIPDPDVGVAAPALPRQFGNYELLEEVARGGMGIVYRARQRTLNRTVALKVLLLGANSSETLLARFQMEAEAAASLQHPHIVAIHEFGEFDDQPYYTMDFVAGRDLSQVCEGRPLEPRRAATYLRTIAETVQFAHGRGVLHRDIKPSNVLIDDDDRSRITDFGLAKRLGSESQMTVSGQMVGSPNYIPPEQALGQEKEIDA
ncbi:MAG TPA: serine/threonine-protein kinase [Opitutaceae bacterium]